MSGASLQSLPSQVLDGGDCTEPHREGPCACRPGAAAPPRWSERLRGWHPRNAVPRAPLGKECAGCSLRLLSTHSLAVQPRQQGQQGARKRQISTAELGRENTSALIIIYITVQNQKLTNLKRQSNGQRMPSRS
eukprot:6182370-Pleurochrysis_carterae.AAC.4